MNHSFRIIVIPILLIGLTLCFTSCKPKPTLAVVTTANASGITQTSATTGGNVTDDGNAEVTARGVCWGTSQNPTTGSNKTSDGSGTGNFTSSIAGLTPGTTYYVRAYATNSEGTSYGNEVTFSSNPVLLATLTTTAASSVTQTTAVSGGNITLDGGGAVTARGVCWSTSQNPTVADSKTTDESGTGSFTSDIIGLTAGTPYYVRAYATNSAGTAYGSQKDFTTTEAVGGIVFNPALTYGTVSDIDGNTYKTIQIGTQTWMAENLKTTKYNDNTLIPLVEDDTEWKDLTTDAYCWYNNDAAAFKTVYGALYNFFAVEDGNLCPTGWHIPTIAELTTLNNYLGEYSGYKLIETGTTHWDSPNSGATNETGFTWLPAGERTLSGEFRNIHTFVYIWSYSNSFVFVGMAYGYGNQGYNAGFYDVNLASGCSVRCLKD